MRSLASRILRSGQVSNYLRSSKKLKYFLFLMIIFCVMRLGYGSIEAPRIPQKLPQVQIDSLGNANAIIDIELPPGTRSIVPKIQIVYSSASNNGILGKGWNLLGLNAIYRSSEDSSTAEFISTEGGKLKYNATEGFYQTIPDSFSKFSADNNSNPTKWTVKDKSEITYSYGSTVDSKISNSNYTVIWGLNQVADSYGNGYSIEYLNSDGNLIPSKISYNETKTVISFEYATRTDNLEAYNLGVKQKFTKLLSSIKVENYGETLKEYTFDYEVKTNTSRLTTVNVTNQEPINFNYSEDQTYPNFQTTQSSTNMSGINYLQTNEDSMKSYCGIWQAACIQSANPDLVMARKVINIAICGMFYRPLRNHCSFGQENSRILYADTNGDRIPELITVSKDTRYSFAIHKLDGSIELKGTAKSLVDPTNKLQLIPGDVDGNFKSDIFMLEDDNAPLRVGNLDRDTYKTFPHILVNLSSSSNDGEKFRTNNFVTDFNGDGKTDFILHRDDKLKVFLNQTVTNNKLQNSPAADAEEKDWQLNEYATLVFNKPYGTSLQTFIDMDKNGTADFVRLNDSKLLVSFYKDKTLIREIEKEIYTTGLPGNQYFADINGDGFIDFISYDGEKFNIYFFDGINFRDNITNTINNLKELKDPEFKISQIGPPCTTPDCIDINNDSKADMLIFDSTKYDFRNTYSGDQFIDDEYKGGLLKIRLYNVAQKKYETATIELVDNTSLYDINSDGQNDIIEYKLFTRKIDKQYGNGQSIKLSLTIKITNGVTKTLPDVDIGDLAPKAEIANLSGDVIYDNWRYTRTFADMNQDGKADFIWYDGNKIYVSYSIGTEQDKVFNPNGDTSFPAEAFHGVADMDLDGRPDFIGLYSEKKEIRSSFEHSEWTNYSAHSGSGVFHIYSSFKQEIPNLLTSISDNKFKAIYLYYGQENQNPSTIDLANASTGKSYFLIKSQIKNRLTSIYFGHGGGFGEGLSYQYNNRVYYKGTENKFGDAGYESIFVSDNKVLPNESITIYKKFSYNAIDKMNLGDLHSPGLLTKEETFVPNDSSSVESRTTNKYKIQNTSLGTQHVVLEGSTEDTLTDDLPPLYKSAVYDGYGNITQSTETFQSESIVVDNQFETVNKSEWRLGRPTNITKKLNGIIVEDKRITYSGKELSSTSNLFDSETNQWVTTRYENYDSYGNPTKVINSKNEASIIGYDTFSHTQMISIKSELTSLQVTREYNKNTGKILSETDTSGVISRKEYDIHGRLVAIYYPGSSTANETYKYTVDSASLIYVEKKLNDGTLSGLWTKEYVNPIGKTIKVETKGFVTNGESTNLIQENEYDALGRIKRKSNSYLQGNPIYYTNYFYNGPFQKLSRIENPDGSSVAITYPTGLSERVVSTGIASDGTSQIINTTTIQKNYRGEIISKRSNNKTITYESGFDVNGRYTKIFSNNGTLKAHERINLAGKKVFHQDKNSGISTMEYDLFGNLTKKKNAENKSIQYEYDSMNRLTKVDRPDNEDDEYLYYDEGTNKGRLTRVVTKHYSSTLGQMKDEIITRFKYAVDGKVTEKITEIDDAKYVFKYRYDSLGRLTKIFHPNGVSVNSKYSESGHLTELTMDSADGTNTDNSLVNYAALPDYRLQRLLGNKVETYVSYNPTNMRPNSLITKLKQTHEVQKWNYSYDASSNLTKIEDRINTGNSQDFAYDSENRMISATGPYGPPESKIQTEAYEYDADNGNLTKKGNMNYSYLDANHENAVTKVRIIKTPSVQDILYTYDLNGNMITRDADQFQFDSQNRMISSTVNSQRNEYLYDYSGNRIRKLTGQDNAKVYTIDGIYEVTKNPSKPDMHTMYIRGMKGDLVSQFSQENIVLMPETALNTNDQSTIDKIALFFTIQIQRTKIQFAKLVFASLHKNPYSIKLFAISALLLFLAAYSYYLASKGVNLDLVRLKIQDVKLFIPKYLYNFVGLYTIFCIAFLFNSCSYFSRTSSGNVPFWALGGFLTQQMPQDTPGIASTPNNNPASTFGTGSAANGGSPVTGMYFFSPDHLGSTSMITNFNGDMVTGVDVDTGKSYVTYKPYGEVNKTNSDGPDIFRHKYSSQQEDSETGLQYFNARYYDPAIGRFISADTIINAGSEQGLDQYAFVHNSPMNYRDPGGRSMVSTFLGSLGSALGALGSAIAMAAGVVGAVMIGVFSPIIGAMIVIAGATIAVANAIYQANKAAIITGLNKMAYNYMLYLKATLYIGVAVAAILIGVALLFMGPFWFVIGCTLIGFGIGAITGYLSGGLGGLLKEGKWDQEEAEARYETYGGLGASVGFMVGVTTVIMPGGYEGTIFAKGAVETGLALGGLGFTGFVFLAAKVTFFALLGSAVGATAESFGKIQGPFGELGKKIQSTLMNDIQGNKARHESQVNEKMPFDNTYDNHLALAFIYGTLWNIDPFQIYAVWAYRTVKNK